MGAAQSSPTAEILAQLEDDTSKAIDKIAQRQQSSASLLQEIDRIGEQMTETAKVADAQQRDTRQAVLTANLQDLHKRVRDEEQDLSQAVLGLNALMGEMGGEFENLTKPSADEVSLVVGAEQQLAAAKQSLVESESAWLFKASKTAHAKEAIAAAEQGIADAKTEAARRARQRLMKATMEGSFQEFMFKVEKTIEIMKARKKDIEGQIQAIGVRKADAYATKEAAAKKLEELDLQLNQIEQQLQAEEDSLTSMVNGSQEYVAQEKKISDLRTNVENVRGQRNTALVLFQSKERFAAELEVHEKSQMKLRDNQRSWITLLMSDTQERVVTFKSRLEAMKAMADQDVAKNLDQIGVEIDARNVEFMAAVGAASDRSRMEMVESNPERVRRIAMAQAAQAEAQQRIREREGKVIEEFKKKYGINPLDSSFFTYQDGADGSAGGPPRV